MKIIRWNTFALAAALTLSTTAFAATKSKPADYNVTVHVIGSANHGQTQNLQVVIDGKPMLLETSGTYYGVLGLGDYQAKPIVTTKMKHAAHDHFEGYEFYFADNEDTRAYFVVGVGTIATVSNPPQAVTQ